MLKRRRNARCKTVADSVLINSRTQKKILCCIVAILLSTDAAARVCARRALQQQYLKIQDLLFQTLCRPFAYRVQFRKYRRTKLSPSFLITLYTRTERQIFILIRVSVVEVAVVVQVLTSADSYNFSQPMKLTVVWYWPSYSLVDTEVLGKPSSILKREAALPSKTSVSLPDYMA